MRKSQDRSVTDQASSVDIHVTLRLRLLRTMQGVTQAQLARALGVSTQMIHKYETGTTRISPGRLYLCAARLDVPVSIFFDHYDPTTETLPARLRKSRTIAAVIETAEAPKVD